jgi:hypothetical protein
MSNPNDLVIEEMEDDVEALFDSILFLEEKNVLDTESVDECLYHLQRLTSILDLDVDVDRLNDEELAKVEAVSETDSEDEDTVPGFIIPQNDLDERVAGFVIDDDDAGAE